MRSLRPPPLRPRHSLFLALAAALVVPALVVAGPPWITIEYPPNPLDRETRGALLVVHTYHHAGSIPAEVSAVAHPVGDGDAHTVTLDVGPTSRPGVYAVRGELPERDAWVVAVTMREGRDGDGAAASALVAMEPGGELTAVRVPHEVRDGWQIPRAATGEDVRAMRETARVLAQAHRGLKLGAVPSGAALAGLVLVPLGALALRRRRRR